MAFMGKAPTGGRGKGGPGGVLAGVAEDIQACVQTHLHPLHQLKSRGSSKVESMLPRVAVTEVWEG